MTLTEEEARKKWCPFVRYKSKNGEGINRWVDLSDVNLSPSPAHCIASECMAWRPRAIDLRTGEIFTPVIGADYATHEVRFVGYCGLAHAP